MDSKCLKAPNNSLLILRKLSVACNKIIHCSIFGLILVYIDEILICMEMMYVCMHVCLRLN